MNARKISMVAIVFAIAMMFCMSGIVNAKPVSFKEANYEGSPDETVSMEVDLENAGLNTSASDIIDGGYISSLDGSWVAYSDDEISDMTDYDYDTGVNQTYRYGEGEIGFSPDPDNMNLYAEYGYIEFNITPITSFDGVMVKKSVGMDIEVSIINNTNGWVSEAIVEFTDGTYSFLYSQNASYKFVDNVDSYESGVMSIEEWVATYGSIDHIAFYESLDDGFGELYSMEENTIYTIDHYCLLDEFHLFNTATTLTSYSIINEDNVTMAWGVEATKISVSKYILEIKIPKDAVLGSYFVTVKDSSANTDTTTLEVVASQEPVNKWMYVFVIGFLGLGLIGCAMLLARKKRKSTGAVGVILIAVVGGLMVVVAVIMSAFLLGYIGFGFGLSILPMMIAMKKDMIQDIRSFCRKNKRILSIGILGILLCSCFATVMATDTSIPTSQSIKPGESFDITIASNTTTFTSTNVICNIEKVDQTTPAYIYWKYVVDPAEDKKSADITFTTTSGVAEGTYIIHIHSGEYFSQYVTVYINTETTAFNWNLFYFSFAGSLLVLVIGAIGFSMALKTGSHTDDYLMMVILLIGAILMIFSICLFMGWLAYFGFTGALAIAL